MYIHIHICLYITVYVTVIEELPILQTLDQWPCRAPISTSRLRLAEFDRAAPESGQSLGLSSCRHHFPLSSNLWWLEDNSEKTFSQVGAKLYWSYLKGLCLKRGICWCMTHRVKIHEIVVAGETSPKSGVAHHKMQTTRKCPKTNLILRTKQNKTIQVFKVNLTWDA